MRYTLLVLTALLITGCASKLAENESEKLLDFSVANSKQIEIKNSETSKTFVTITYLNPIQHDLIRQDTEKFIVGTYYASGDASFATITLSNFHVNGKDANISVTPLAKDAPLLKLVPSSNAWTKYVLVQAPKTEQEKMEISFENDQSVKVKVTFQKDF